MRFGSICSGIEAASVAWGSLGWEAAWFAEIEPFPSAVLAHHYPYTINVGDMTALPALIRSGAIEAPEVLCGGTPCQAFSVAGKRQSLDDARGNLTLTFCDIADAIDEVRNDGSIIFWENVPGVLNTKDNAFGCFLGALSGESGPLEPAGAKWSNAGVVLGPKRAIAWRVLDAQYFGVAQRRRRVFVVASARGGFDPAAVLFEFDGLRRDSAPRREAGEGTTHATASCLTSSGRGVERTGDTRGQDPVVACITLAHGQGGAEVGFDRGPTLTCNHEAPIAAYAIQAGALRTNPASGPDGVGVQEGHAYTLEARAEVQAVAFAQNSRDEVRLMGGDGQIVGALAAEPGMKQTCYVAQPAVALQDVRGMNKAQNGRGWNDEGAAYTVDTHATQGVATAMQVRRLTPVECERLQGFPEIVKTCTITVFQHSNFNVCSSDQQSTDVLAALQSHKSPSNASPAEENVFPSSVNAAERSLNASHTKSSAPVLVNAQIDLERQHLQLHSQGKLLLSASIADANEWCRLPIQAGDFAQMSVVLLSWLEKITPRGKVGSHLNTSGSFPLLIGNWFASQSGREIEELVNDAEKFMSAVKSCTTFITSEAGRNFQNCESNLQTLLCCVTTVISSFIQSEIRNANSYALSIEVSHGYTLIPWRKKPASECPDGPRYKALGNSWAVPVVRWIGRRIDAIASK